MSGKRARFGKQYAGKETGPESGKGALRRNFVESDEKKLSNLIYKKLNSCYIYEVKGPFVLLN